MAESLASQPFWDKIARRYAADPIKDMPGYERSLERTAHHLGRNDHVLEIGCGTGMTALRLAPLVAQLGATDAAPEMIAIARERADEAACRNITFSVAQAHRIDVPASSLDAVLAFNLLHLVSDRGAVLQAVRRALKPGGLFISKTPCLSEMSRLVQLAVPVMRAVGKAPFVSFFNGEELEREIEAAGFTTFERGRHGSGRKEPRLFLVAGKTGV